LFFVERLLFCPLTVSKTLDYVVKLEIHDNIQSYKRKFFSIHFQQLETSNKVNKCMS